VLLCRAHWVSPIPPRPSCFQAALAVFQTTPAPAHLRSRVHPLRYFAPSSESTSASNLPFWPQPKDAFHEVLCLLRDVNPGNPLAAGFPSFLPMVRPQRFSRSRRLTLPKILRAYFIPQPRLRFTLQGLSPMPSQCDSSPPCSLMTFCDSHLCSQVSPATPDPEAWPSEP
jgi:hypothetical protein